MKASLFLLLVSQFLLINSVSAYSVNTPYSVRGSTYSYGYSYPPSNTPNQANVASTINTVTSRICYLNDSSCMSGGSTYYYAPSYSWSTYDTTYTPPVVTTLVNQASNYNNPISVTPTINTAGSKICYLNDSSCMSGGSTYNYTPSYSWSTYGSSQYMYTH